MRVFMQDVRFGARTLAQRPSFTIVATLVLALGIAATTTIFSVVDAVLLKPLPYPDPERLVMVWETNLARGIPEMNVAPPNLADWRTRSRSFDSLGAWVNRAYTVQRGGTAEQLQGAALTHEIFAVLRVQPVVGRLFTVEEHAAGGAQVVLISYPYWQREFGGDPSAVGQRLRINDEAREIVGVMPEGFDFAPPVELEGVPTLTRNDIWTPLAANNLFPQRGAHYLLALGRLTAEADPEGAERELRGIAGQIAAEHPDTNTGWSVRVVPFAQQVTGDQRPAIAALGVASGMVLLLACANVAALMLARGVGRRRELAIRGALGATNWRIVRQLLTEGLVLAAIGGIAGSVLASWMARAVRSMGGPLLPRLDEVAADGRAFGFAVLSCLVAAVLFGALPALHATRASAREWLTQRGGPLRTARLQSALVVVELALSVVLLSAAMLLGAAFVRLIETDPGFRAEQVLTGHVTLPRTRYADRAQRAAFLDRVLERLRTSPGVVAAGAVDAAPLADDRQGTTVTIEGGAPGPQDEVNVNFAFVTPDYFDALGVSIIRGRDFTPADRAGSVPVVIVNEAFARRFFGIEDPIGRRIRAGFNTQTPREIIAVVADERHESLRDEPPPGMFATFAQVGWATQITLAVRTSGDPSGLAGVLREAVAGIDPEVPLYDVRTMEQVVRESVSRPRFTVVLLGTFAAIALLLAAVGVYGVMSQAVAQRLAEFGVRLALGAAPRDLRALVFRFSLRLGVLGLAIGLPVALIFGRVLASMLTGVEPSDPAGYAFVALVLGATVVIAAFFPARRASRVDPIVALRTD